MSKKQLAIIIGVLIVVAIVAGVYLVQKDKRAIASHEEFTSYNTTTENDLRTRHEQIVALVERDEKKLAQYDSLVSLLEEQIGLIQQRQDQLPTLKQPIFSKATTLNADQTKSMHGELAGKYKEFLERQKFERRAEKASDEYLKSQRTNKDYTNMISVMAGIADELASQSFATEYDKSIASQYKILRDQTKLADAAYERRDRPAYDEAIEKADKAFEEIGKIGERRVSEETKLLAKIEKIIDRISD